MIRMKQEEIRIMRAIIRFIHVFGVIGEVKYSGNTGL